MTINRMRLIAAAGSFLFIPAFFFGVVTIWSALEATLLTYLVHHEMAFALAQSEEITDHIKKSKYCNQKIYKSWLSAAWIASLGVLTLLIFTSMSISEIHYIGRSSLLDIKIYDAVLQIVVKNTNTGLLTVNQKIIAQTSFHSLIWISLSFVFCEKQTLRLMRKIFYIRALDFPDAAKKFLVRSNNKIKMGVEFGFYFLLPFGCYLITLQTFLVTPLIANAFLSIFALVTPIFFANLFISINRLAINLYNLM